MIRLGDYIMAEYVTVLLEEYELKNIQKIMVKFPHKYSYDPFKSEFLALNFSHLPHDSKVIFRTFGDQEKVADKNSYMYWGTFHFKPKEIKDYDTYSYEKKTEKFDSATCLLSINDSREIHMIRGSGEITWYADGTKKMRLSLEKSEMIDIIKLLKQNDHIVSVNKLI